MSWWIDCQNIVIKQLFMFFNPIYVKFNNPRDRNLSSFYI